MVSVINGFSLTKMNEKKILKKSNCSEAAPKSVVTEEVSRAANQNEDIFESVFETVP